MLSSSGVAARGGILESPDMPRETEAERRPLDSIERRASTTDAMATTRLPSGSAWRTEGFNGAVLTYKTLRDTSDASASLQEFWSGLLASGQQHMLAKDTED